MRRLTGFLAMIILMAAAWSCRVLAAETVGQNPETEYRLVLADKADLLTDAQERELADAMYDITAYGHAGFLSVQENSFSAEQCAREYYREWFGTQSGTLFLIDMDNRMLWIHSDGAVYKVITNAYADTITDNVYRKASGGDYLACASEGFGQILTLLEGERIAQPMKYISNGLLAMILALLLNFGLVCRLTCLKKPGRRERLRNVKIHFSATEPVAEFAYESKVYDPVSSDSSSSGGSSRSSGGGGGSSRSSGGGGGHRF